MNKYQELKGKCRRRLIKLAIENARAFQNGEPINVVN